MHCKSLWVKASAKYKFIGQACLHNLRNLYVYDAGGGESKEI